MFKGSNNAFHLLTTAALHGSYVRQPPPLEGLEDQPPPLPILPQPSLPNVSKGSISHIHVQLTAV